MSTLSEFVKSRRKIEQGKTNLNLDKVNLVLRMFGHELAPINSCELKAEVYYQQQLASVLVVTDEG